MSCVLVVFDVEILLGGFNQSKLVYLPLVNHIVRGKIHAVCSYYICTFFKLHELVLIAKWLTRGMIIFADG